MFGINGFNKNYFLGVDFGTSSIKAIELEYKNGSVYLSNYGWIELPPKKKVGEFEIKKDDFDDEENINLLKKLFSEMDIKSNKAYISMGSFRGLSALVTINDMQESAFEEAVRSEASKYIPVSLDEVYLSSDIVSRKSTGTSDEDAPKASFLGKKEKEVLEVLLVAAPKEDVHKYERIIEGCGLSVASFELDIFSVTRALVGDNLGKFLIIDIGAKITNIVLVDKGIVRINRNINIGGDEITKNISTNLNVSWDRAEEFKKKNNYLKEEGKSIVLPILNLIAKEAKRVVELTSAGNNVNKPVDKVILAGGSSNISGAVEIFSEVLGGNVAVGNPLDGILIENDRIKEILPSFASRLSVVKGLAIKGVANHK